MLKAFGRRLAGGLVAAAMMAVAAGIVLVAAAFGVYVGLKPMVAPAAAAALTALAFAAVAGVIALIAPPILRGKGASLSARAPADPHALRTTSEVGMAILALLGELVLKRRKRAPTSKSRA